MWISKSKLEVLIDKQVNDLVDIAARMLDRQVRDIDKHTKDWTEKQDLKNKAHLEFVKEHAAQVERFLAAIEKHLRVKKK